MLERIKIQDSRFPPPQVNNAGILGPREMQLSQDGLELTLHANHFGHFLLTNLLLGALGKPSWRT